MLGLVSNPSWHGAFYAAALRHVLEAGERRVLISGAADYSMLAHVANAATNHVDVTVLDWCETPLIANRWYAQKVALRSVTTVAQDAREHLPRDSYDVVVSDSFLPRFDSRSVHKLVRTWRDSLSPNGLAITTVRIHPKEHVQQQSKASIAARWGEVAEDAAAWWPMSQQVPIADLAERARAFALRQERTANVDPAELRNLFMQEGFTSVDVSEVNVAGKTFAQVIAR